MASSERRLAAVMFTDIVGYSTLTQRDEELSMELLREHNEIMREVFSRYGGQEIKTIGDAFHLEFPSALQACKCAIEMQQALNQRNDVATGERVIKIRIGIHVGDVMPEDGDIFGDVVNIAARIESKAGAGQICISEDVYNQVRNKIEHKTLKLGRARLKNIDSPINIYQFVLPWERKQMELALRLRFQYQQNRQRIAAASLLILILGGAGYLWATQDNTTRIAFMPIQYVGNFTDEAVRQFEGLQDSLGEKLTLLENVVVPRMSRTQFNGIEDDLQSFGENMEADYLVSLKVTSGVGSPVVEADLFDMKSDNFIGGTNFTYFSSALAERNIAELIVENLKLPEIEREYIEEEGTQSDTAQDLYNEGLLHLRDGTEASIKNAIRNFQLATDEDPGFARAHAAKSIAYLLDGRSSAYVNPAANDALEIDNRIAKAHTALAFSLWVFDRDMETAEVEFKIALELNREDMLTRTLFAQFLTALNERKRAIALFTELQSSAIEDPSQLLGLAEISFYGKQFGDAEDYASRSIAADPTNSYAHALLGLALLKLGEDENALASFQIAASYAENTSHCIKLESIVCQISLWSNLKMLVRSYFGLYSAEVGDAEEAGEIIDELTFFGNKFAYEIATIFDALGDVNEAIKWLERAKQYHPEFPLTLEYVAVDPRFDSVRRDPRFEQLIAQLRLSN